jgi:hypothetical protein
MTSGTVEDEVRHCARMRLDSKVDGVRYCGGMKSDTIGGWCQTLWEDEVRCCERMRLELGVDDIRLLGYVVSTVGRWGQILWEDKNRYKDEVIYCKKMRSDTLRGWAHRHRVDAIRYSVGDEVRYFEWMMSGTVKEEGQICSVGGWGQILWMLRSDAMGE